MMTSFDRYSGGSVSGALGVGSLWHAGWFHVLRHGGVTMGGHRTATEDVSLPGKEKKRSGELVAGELDLVIMDNPQKI